MRVAFVTAGFGALSETFVVNQIRGVIARGHDVEILACGAASGAQQEAAVCDDDLRRRVRPLPVPNSLLKRIEYVGRTVRVHSRRAPALCARAVNAFRFGRMAASGRLYCSAAPFMMHGVGRYDVIHAQFGPLGVWALKLRQIGAIEGALVTAFRGYDATQYLRSHPHAYRTLFAEGDGFLPVCRTLARELARHQCPTDRIEVHHSGIELTRFPFRARTRSPGEPARLMTIARLVEKKGIRYAIEAMARLIRAGESVTYDVIGDGPERASLTELVERLGLQRQVRLLGWRQPEEVRALLDTAHILVAPSVTASNGDQEGIPNVLKEAMAMGLPVIATDHGGNAELVEDGVSGFLVPEHDAAALSVGIANALALVNRWPEMGRAGRGKVESEFNIELLAQELDDVYERTISRYRERLGQAEKVMTKLTSEAR